MHTKSPVAIPIPPMELRTMVGPTDLQAFDNPSGKPIFAEFGLPLEAYESVFDFGCGCGRLARQLLQQDPRPKRYVGVDVHQGMIDWCTQNLSPIDPNFKFLHHDVYTPCTPNNKLRLAAPFPVFDNEFTLVIANSVFTHLFRRQTEYYLREMTRILKPQSVALTTWFFFDSDGFPFLKEGPYCLFAGENDPTQAVIYDRQWFVETLRLTGFDVRSVEYPVIPGHQWTVLITNSDPEAVDHFPLGKDGAEWLCGAPWHSSAADPAPPEFIEKLKITSSDSQSGSHWPQPPALFGPLVDLEKINMELALKSAELEKVKRELASTKSTITWKLRRLIRGQKEFNK